YQNVLYETFYVWHGRPMEESRFPQLLDATTTGTTFCVPELVQQQGEHAQRRFIEFFTARIRNRGTRGAYARAAAEFLDWCDRRAVSLQQVTPIVVATYIEQLTAEYSAPTVKLRLAALRSLFDHLVTGQVMPMNPAASVRGPRHVVKKGSTPVLRAEEARQLIDSIEGRSIVGLRDRALIGVMVYSFARVSAAIGMNVEDYYSQGRRMWLRLHEKGGKRHDVPAHHNAEAYLDAYLAVAGIRDEKKGPLFRTVSRRRELTLTRMHRVDVLRMIKRRARQAGISTTVCCHTFRATGITTYLENGGQLEHAQQIAAHESARTTKLYDRTSDAVSLDEIERIMI
ncbi:MAG: tyrosine-type recombinase/integrase, partial [Planctomycetales bacterium]|nr:tyrosine-type recombinase/integrase [Planctomycetales bacterium]